MKQNVWYVCNVHITHIYTQRKLHGLTVWRESEIRASHNIMKMIITATISSSLIPLVWREKNIQRVHSHSKSRNMKKTTTTAAVTINKKPTLKMKNLITSYCCIKRNFQRDYIIGFRIA